VWKNALQNRQLSQLDSHFENSCPVEAHNPCGPARFSTADCTRYTLTSSSRIEFSGFKWIEAFEGRNTMQRKATAVWSGGLKDGKGSLSTDSGVLKQTQYSFSARFENGIGTNPEELLAAAHAGCFTMALSAQLGGAGMTAQKLETTATITLEKVGDGFTITKSHLDLVAKIPGADKGKFDAAVKAAETGCPVSKLFKAEITVSAQLQS
jgi:osmotically inducible protein OsmC